MNLTTQNRVASALSAIFVTAILLTLGVIGFAPTPSYGTLRAVAGGSGGGISSGGAATINPLILGNVSSPDVLYVDPSGVVTGSANLTYVDANRRLTVGSGTTTSSGWNLGYSGTSGTAQISWATDDPTIANNWVLSGSAATTTIGKATGGANLLLRNGNGTINMNGGALLPSDATYSLGGASNHFTKLYLDYTNTGTVGAVTINKAAGRINIAAAGSTVVVTNSLSTAATHCFVNINSTTVDATLTTVSCDTSTPGQITVRGNTTATSQRAVDFLLVNAD